MSKELTDYVAGTVRVMNTVRFRFSQGNLALAETQKGFLRCRADWIGSKQRGCDEAFLDGIESTSKIEQQKGRKRPPWQKSQVLRRAY